MMNFTYIPCRVYLEYDDTLNHYSIQYQKNIWKGYSSGESAEAVVKRCSIKKVFLEIAQNSQENTCERASGTGVSCEVCKISKYTFFTKHLSWLLLNLTVGSIRLIFLAADN